MFVNMSNSEIKEASGAYSFQLANRRNQMTAVVGFTNKTDVWIGADSAGVDGWGRIVARADRKVWRQDEWIYGACGSYRQLQLLRTKFRPPKPREGEDLEEYMVGTFVEKLRTLWKDAGCVKKKDEVEIGGNFLVGWRGRLFHIESDYQVAESADYYDAAGSGEQIALGALAAQFDYPPIMLGTAAVGKGIGTCAARTLTPYEIRSNLNTALAIAEKHISSVRRPFHIVSTEEEK